MLAKRIIQTFLDAVIDELAQGNRLEFRDFGVFEHKDRLSRTAQNPKTLARVKVPAKRTVKFKMGRLMKKRMQESMAARAGLDPRRDTTGESESMAAKARAVAAEVSSDEFRVSSERRSALGTRLGADH